MESMSVCGSALSDAGLMEQFDSVNKQKIF